MKGGVSLQVHKNVGLHSTMSRTPLGGPLPLWAVAFSLGLFFGVPFGDFGPFGPFLGSWTVPFWPFAPSAPLLPELGLFGRSSPLLRSLVACSNLCKPAASPFRQGPFAKGPWKRLWPQGKIAQIHEIGQSFPAVSPVRAVH
jgi:hypothetical protein